MAKAAKKVKVKLNFCWRALQFLAKTKSDLRLLAGANLVSKGNVVFVCCKKNKLKFSI
jgi:hypothetical protein